MAKNYSVDDILGELEGKKSSSKSSQDDFEKIMEELLGKKKTSEVPSKEDKKPIFKELPKTEEKPFKPIIEEKPAVEDKTITEEKPIISNKSEEQSVSNGDTVSFDSKEVKAKVEKKGFKVKIDYDKAEIEEEQISEPEKKNDLSDKTVRFEPIGSEKKVEQETVEETVSVNEDLAEFRESRKKKVETFVLFGDDEEDNEPEPEPEIAQEVKTIEDFNDYSETTAIIKDLSSIKASLSLRFIILSVLTLVSAYIELGAKLHIPVPAIFDRGVQPVSYLIVSALVFAAAVLVSAPAVFGGISSLFRLKADGDSILSVSVIGSAIQYVALFLSPLYISTAKNTVCIYGFIAIVGMLLNTLGKLFIIRRVRLNFRFASGGYEKYAIVYPESEKLENFVKEEFDAGYATVAVPRKTDFIGGFLSYSYREDASDNISKILSPILLAGSIVLGVVSFVFVRDFQKAASVMAAVTAISAPVSVMICVNFPLFRTVKKLISRGCMISGVAGCNEVYDTNAVLVKSADLFPKGSIQLSAIKTFAAGKIDDVILDAASVVIKAESDLSDVFLSVIEGRRDLLREVDSIVYEESMGLSAWVDSKRVLIGNRNLISNHGIAVPSKDYEDRYLNTGMDVVYLAESGELVAVFLIQYKPGTQIKKSMKALQKLGIGVIVASTDPNIDDRKIAKIFDVNRDMIRTVPAEKQGETERLSRQTPKEIVGTASISSFSAFVQTIYAAIKLKGIVSLSVTLHTLGAILGFAIMTFFTIVSGSISISVEAILLYQMFWLAAVIIIPCFRKTKI